MEALQNAGSAIQMRWCRFYFNGKQTQWDFLLTIKKEKKEKRKILIKLLQMHNSEPLHILLSSCPLQLQWLSCTWRKQLQWLLPQVLNHFHLPSCSVLSLLIDFIDWIISTITLSGCISIILYSRAVLRSSVFAEANFPTNSNCSSNAHISASGFSMTTISRRESIYALLVFCCYFCIFFFLI